MVLVCISFFILQTIVFLIFYLRRNDKDDFAIKKLFQSKLHFISINGCVFIHCYVCNNQWQLFCKPVLWAAILLILFCSAFLMLPFITRQSTFLNLIVAICGLGFFISLYVILFGRFEYLIFVAFNLPFIYYLHIIIKDLQKKYDCKIFYAFYFYPAIVLTPFLLIYQLWLLLRHLNVNQKRLFIATPICCLLIAIILTAQMNNIIHQIAKAKDKEQELKTIIDNPINNYLTELILGAHWKYHTQLCLFDGWRPPFHDPALVIANKVLFPFSMFYQGTELQNAIQLYKKLYPNNATTFDCKCAKQELLFH